MEDWNCGRCRSRNTDLYKGRRRDKCTSCYLTRDKAKPVPAVVPTVLSKSPGAACVPPTTGACGHITPRRDFPSSNGVTPAAGASRIVNPETHNKQHQPQSLPLPSPQLLPFSPAVHPSPHHLHQPPPPSHQPQGPPPPQVLAPRMAPLPPPPQAPNKDEGAGVLDYAWTREKAAAKQLPPLALHTTADAAPECAAASRTCGVSRHTHTHCGLTPLPPPPLRRASLTSAAAALQHAPYPFPQQQQPQTPQTPQTPQLQPPPMPPPVPRPPQQQLRAPPQPPPQQQQSVLTVSPLLPVPYMHDQT